MKRKIWVTAGIAAALAFLIAFGAVGCVVSGFDLPLDSYAKVVLICGAAGISRRCWRPAGEFLKIPCC